MIVHEWTALGDDSLDEGRRFGAAWAPQLTAALVSYLELFQQTGVSSSVASEVAEGCRDATEQYAPAVSAEFRGMAEGSGLSISDVYLLASRTEVLARTTPSMECSTIVHVPADGGGPRTLQTWDWHETLSNETVVRRFRAPSGARVATFCEFGQPAKIGVNDRGLGLHFNILHHRSDGTQTGIPVHVLARMILEDARTVDEALSIAESVPLAASSVLTVAGIGDGAAEAASIEVSPAAVAVIAARPGHTLAHTNHFLDPDLAAGEFSPYETTSIPRYECLVDAADLARIPDHHERAMAFGAIRDAPISVRPRADQPAHLRWESKLTVALDVVDGALEYAAAAPADVADATWVRVSTA